MQLYIKNSFLLYSIMCFNLLMYADNTQEIQEQQAQIADAQLQEKIYNELESIQRRTETSLGALAEILQELVLEINAGVIKSKNNTKLKKSILHYRELISRHHTLMIGMTAIDPVKLHDTLHFIHAMTSQLTPLIHKGLQELPLFDDQTTKMSKSLGEITLEELHEQCQKNEAGIKKLKEKTTKLALGWHNKAWRGVTRLWSACKGSTATKYAIAASALGLYYLFRSDWDNPTFRSFVGHSPIYIEKLFNQIRRNKLGYGEYSGEQIALLSDVRLHSMLVESYPLKAPGMLEEWKIDFDKGLHPFLGLLGGSYLLNQTQGHLARLGAFISKKGEAVSNWLKGGVYKNTEHGIAHEFTSTTVFEDVIGCESIKRELQEKIIRFLLSPEKYIRQKITPEKGWLFSGPSRTGKSFMVEALCGEITNVLASSGRNKEFKFFSFNASEVLTHGIKVIVDVMKQYAPCVVFIDEIDLLNLQRVGNSTLLSEFLTTMSGYMTDDPEKLVILIGATNKPETLDKSLRQHGRFGKEIRFEKPSFANRKEYLMRRFEKLALDISQINLDKLAYETYGCVYEDIEAMIKTALQEAKSQGRVLDQYLLEEAFNTEVRRINPNRAISLLEREIVAIHQIGTAMAHVLLQSRDLVSLVTARPITANLKEEMHHQEYLRDEKFKQQETLYGETFTFRADDGIGISTIDDMITECKVLLAGNIAEKMVRGNCSYSYRPEKKHKAFQLAKEIACEGIHPNQLSDDLRDKATEKAWKMIQEYEQELTKLLEKHKSHLTLLTLLLLEQDVTGELLNRLIALDKKEVESILTEIQNATKKQDEELATQQPKEIAQASS